MDLIQKMLDSGNKTIVAAANDMSKWKELKHDKTGLETFLKYNIALIRFRKKNAATYKTVTCTSNTRFIEVFSKLKSSEKKEALKSKFDGIKTKDLGSTMTFDLMENKYCTIPLLIWNIVHFISITEDNIEILDGVVNEILKRKTIDDIKK